MGAQEHGGRLVPEYGCRLGSTCLEKHDQYFPKYSSTDVDDHSAKRVKNDKVLRRTQKQPKKTDKEQIFRTDIAAAHSAYSRHDSGMQWLVECRKRLTASKVGSIKNMKQTTKRSKKVHNLLYSTFRGETTRYGSGKE